MIEVEMLRPTADEMLSGLSADGAMKQRLLFAANAVEHLPQVAQEMLGGLHATPALRHRILVAAERKKQKSVAVGISSSGRRPVLTRITPAIGMALVLVLMIGLGASYGGKPTIPGLQVAQTDLGSGMAGAGGDTDSSVPGYHSLFVGEGANPPLVGVHGRYYRMLSVHVPADVVSTAIAEIQEFTDEPSLASPVGVISNVVKVGTQVYAVDGISSKTACIAEVDGVLRLFQRVGYASDGVVGREQFEDTLDVHMKVSAIELSGVGTINDETLANELIYSLYEFAELSGNDLSGGSQAITIYLRNGLSLQLLVDGDIISGCGSWACPDFFSEFAYALSKQN